MGTTSPQTHHLHFSRPKKQFALYALYALLPLALLHYLLFTPLPAPKPPLLVPPQAREGAATVVPSRHGHAPANAREELPPPPPPDHGLGGRETQAGEVSVSPACDYSDGEWVPDARPPLYNGTSCGTIKDGQNCMAHGRPDTGYLHWRWRPPGLLPGGVPPLAPQQAPGLRRRLPGAQPGRVAALPPLLPLPAGPRVPGRRGQQVPAVGLPRLKRHRVQPLVAAPRQGRREGGAGRRAPQQRVPRLVRRAVDVPAGRARRRRAVRRPLVPHPRHLPRRRRGRGLPRLRGPQPHRDRLLRRVQGSRAPDARRGRPAARRGEEGGRLHHLLAGALRGGLGQGRGVPQETAVQGRREGAGLHGDGDEEDRRGGGGPGRGQSRSRPLAVRGAGRDEAGQPAAGRPPGAIHAQRPVRRRRGRPGAERLRALVHARPDRHVQRDPSTDHLGVTAMIETSPITGSVLNELCF